jgi:predicted alpha/beta-hydrolase family hydrolase
MAIEVETASGPARAEVRSVDSPRAALVLGHGAAGGTQAPDVQAAAGAALAQHVTVALVEQPYRVAGRRSPPRAPQLDAAWIAVVERLRAEELAGLPLIGGGRSLGARVACRTAAQTGAVAVLCLAFPLRPPARQGKPRQDRSAELDEVEVPVLVIQGERDRFGMPGPGARREVVRVPGDHGLKADTGAVADAVRDWLARIV